MLAEITEWLANGCNYDQGVSLFERFGSNAFFKRVFKSGITPYNRQKLNELLTALRDSVNEKPAAKIKTVPPVANVPAAPTNEALPPLLQVTKLRDQTFKELCSLHPYLHITPEGEELRELATRIVKLGKANALHWERYNFLSEGGVDEPVPVKAPILININLLNEREAMRKSLNKAEQRIKGIEKPNPKTLQLIAERKIQLKEMDERIAAIKKGKHL